MCIEKCVCMCMYIYIYINISAVKRLIVINRIYCLHNICVYCVYLCIYKYTHIQYIF